MGWLFTQGQTKEELIQRLTKGWDNEDAKGTCLAHCVRGNVLWTVFEVHIRKETPNYSKGEVTRFIGCNLMQTEKNYGWGYKNMDESMGPSYYDCPLSYLKMVPEEKYLSSVNMKWREDVLKYHAQKDMAISAKKSYNLLDHKKYELIIKLKCTSVPEIQMISAKPFRGIYNGRLYRIPSKMVESYEVKEK